MRKIRSACAAALAVVMMLALTGCKDKEESYAAAKELFLAEKYARARAAFVELDNYSESKDFVRECDYRMAMAHYEEEDYETAAIAFRALGKYKESARLAQNCDYQIARGLYDAGDYEGAVRELTPMGNYKNSAKLAQNAADILLKQQLTGRWEYTIDLTDEAREAFEKQEELEKYTQDTYVNFMDYVELEEFSAAMSLQIDEDGFAEQKVKDTSSKKSTISMRKRVSDALAAFQKDNLEEMRVQWDVPMETLLEEHGVTEESEMFEYLFHETMEAAALKLFPNGLLESLLPTDSAVGVCKVENGEITVRLNRKDYKAELDEEGKTLTLSEIVKAENEDGEEEETVTAIVYTRKQ